jgi:NADPH:quinone reductase
MNSCTRSVPFPSTIVRVQSIALRVPWKPAVVDYAFDPVGGANTSRCIDAEAPWLALVSWAHQRNFPNWPYLRIFPLERGRAGTFYGITKLYRKDPQPVREDLPKIFALLAARKIDALI